MAVRTHDSIWRLALSGLPILVGFAFLGEVFQGDGDALRSPLALGILGGFAAVGALVAGLTARSLSGTAAVAVARAAAGPVALRGTAEAAPGRDLLRSPGGQPCLWFKHARQGTRSYDASDSAAPFVLRDETGACLVLPAGADVHGGGVIHGSGERLLRAGDPVHVVGRFVPASAEAIALQERAAKLAGEPAARPVALPVVAPQRLLRPYVIAIGADPGAAGMYRFLTVVDLALLALAAFLFALPARAAPPAEEGLPPRSAWRVRASASTQASLAPSFAIDGDPATKWGGAFSPGHWLELDLGRPAGLGGVILRWDVAHPTAYEVQVSLDGETWRTAFETGDSPGGTELLAFAPVSARYLRVASAPRTADWGVNLFEVVPLGADAAPRLAGPAGVWAGTSTLRLERRLELALPPGEPVAGLEVFWAGARGAVRLEGRTAAGGWGPIAEDLRGEGPRSFLAARAPGTFTALRLTAAPAAPGGPAAVVKRLRLLGPARVETPLRRYQLAAEGRHAALFPATLRGEQVYWTVVGAPAAHAKAVLDEWGDLEARKGAPLVQPLWRDAAGAVAAYGREVEHGLREGWMPMPRLRWSPRPGLELTTEAFAADGPVTWVRHRLVNRGAAPVEGELSVLVRPIQVSPPWQNGGPSPIHAVALHGDLARTEVRVDGRPLLVSLTRADGRGAAAFGTHGEGELTRALAEGRPPAALEAHDADGLAAAHLRYAVRLAPGEARDVVLAFPLGDAAPSLPAGGLDALAAEVAAGWQARLGRIGLTLPDRSLVDMLRAQAAYMLVNQTGPALQAGPRNYDRSFIRDGSATAAALLRMGEAATARAYLRWYATHAVHEDGLVSPILNGDGTVNRGFGSDLEYDSQGEFLYLVAEVARLDGGPATVREYEPEVRRALRFLQALRERTLVPGYLADQPAPERFRGILAPSISHEGYPVPTHSYWDDHWALKGWRDGGWLLAAWGDAGGAAWARGQHEALHASVAASMRATMAWKGADHVPAAADLGDGDPAGVSIGLDPCGNQELFPPDALARTFDRYLAEVRARDAPGALWAYTPYELRNVLTFVRLDRPAEAAELLERFLAGRRPAAWQVLAEVVQSQVRRPQYLGDMPHTWIGSEYARTIWGMLMHEGDGVLELLPGTPPAWVEGGGLAVSALPTAHGTLGLRARREGDVLTIELDPGLRPDVAVRAFWPGRVAPTTVTVDGAVVKGADARGIRLERPFRRLVARW